MNQWLKFIFSTQKVESECGTQNSGTFNSLYYNVTRKLKDLRIKVQRLEFTCYTETTLSGTNYNSLSTHIKQSHIKKTKTKRIKAMYKD